MPTVIINPQDQASAVVQPSAQPSPAQQVISPNTPIVVTDSTGRKITLKKPGVLAQFRFVSALGADAENNVYMGMAMPLLYVADVGGEPVNPFFKKSEVEALIQRLDDHGVSAVVKGVRKHFAKKKGEAGVDDDEDDEVEAVKK